MGQIRLHFKNYKQIGVNEPEVFQADGDIILISGKCRSGKTGIINAIHEAWMLKSITPEPLTRGQDMGTKKVTIPDINGNPVTIVHNFDADNPVGTFYAIDSKGKPINSPQSIKKLIGDYAPISAIDFFYDMKTAEGRRKLVRNYLLPLIGDNYNRIVEINKMINEGGTKFKDRTNLNNEHKAMKTIIESTTITPEERAYILKEEAYKTALNSLKELQTNTYNSINHVKNVINELTSFKFSSNIESVCELFVADVYAKKDVTLSELQEVLENLNKVINGHVDDSDPANIKTVPALITRIETGEKALQNIALLKQKIESYDKSVEGLDKKQKEIDDINTEIQKLKDERTKLLSSSKLPTGLSTDGETITLNGFDFVAEQVSGSEAMLAIAEVMAQLFSGKIIVLGPITEFDKPARMKILELCKKYEKMAVLTAVIDETDLTVQAIVEE